MPALPHGSMHCATPADNVLWSTGASAYAGRFGSPNSFAPVKWNFGTITDITCGSASTLVVTSTGKVYSFGGGNAYVARAV